MIPRLQRTWRGAILASLPFLAVGCGSGSAALFSSASDDDQPEAFELRFDQASPTMYASMTVAQVQANHASSQRFVELAFTKLPAAGSVQRDDFQISRIDGQGNVFESFAPAKATRVSGLVVLELAQALTLNGIYKVTVVGGMNDESGLGLTGPRSAFLQVSSGSFSEEELVAFGNLSAGGLRLGGANRVFASLEAGFFDPYSGSSTYGIATNSAPSDALWDVPRLLYQNSGDQFDEPNTGSVQLNGDTAMIRLQEGKLSQIHSSSNDKSIRVKVFPGAIPAVGSDIQWPNLVLGGLEPERYAIDRAPELDAEKSISWRPRTVPLNGGQLAGAFGSNVVTWWAWTSEGTDSGGQANFGDYHVFASALPTDLSFTSDWPSAIKLSGADTTVGWPHAAAWSDGKLVSIWHEAASQTALYESVMTRYSAARYDARTNSWGPTTLYNPGGDLGRIGDIECHGDDEFLVFSRVDVDGQSQPLAGAERAKIAVRRLAFDASGTIIDSPTSPVTGGVFAPDSTAPDGAYGIGLGYEGALNSSTKLPSNSAYSSLRSGIDRRIPSAQAIDGRNYLVTWESVDSSGDPQVFLAVFDAELMVWRNGEVIEFFSQIGLDTASISTFQIEGLIVDRLGFASVVWSEGPRSAASAVRAVRTSASLLNNSLAAAFPTSLQPDDTVVEFAPNPSGGGVFPAFPGVSNVDSSGHFAIAWARRFFGSSGPGQFIGTNSKRFR